MKTAATVMVDNQGVRFGDGCWVSHDAIVGWTGDDGSQRDNFYRNSVLARQYAKWVREQLDASNSPR